MNKKYYDGGIVTEILLTHLEAEKMFEVLKAFADVKGVDAVEVVRCKDCKWYYRGGATCMYWDGENNIHGDDYCSRAERKEE